LKYRVKNFFTFFGIINKGVRVLFKKKKKKILYKGMPNIKILDFQINRDLNFYSDFFISSWYNIYPIFFNRLKVINIKSPFQNFARNALRFDFGYFSIIKKILDPFYGEFTNLKRIPDFKKLRHGILKYKPK
jgi:hypothetical protein